MTHARANRFGWLLTVALLLMPALALAGGWSVTTLDETPEGVQAGKPFTVGFTVRAHGRTPIDSASPILTFTNADGERIKTAATHDGKPGHYVATVTLPSAGAWNWQIDTYGEPARLSPLTVAAPAAAQTATLGSGDLIRSAIWIISLVTLVMVVSLAFVLRTGRGRRVRAEA